MRGACFQIAQILPKLQEFPLTFFLSGSHLCVQVTQSHYVLPEVKCELLAYVSRQVFFC